MKKFKIIASFRRIIKTQILFGFVVKEIELWMNFLLKIKCCRCTYLTRFGKKFARLSNKWTLKRGSHVGCNEIMTIVLSKFNETTNRVTYLKNVEFLTFGVNECDPSFMQKIILKTKLIELSAILKSASQGFSECWTDCMSGCLSLKPRLQL